MKILMQKKLTKKKFNKSLLKVLVCPITKKKLIYDESKNVLLSKKAKLAYPIINGIPVLIVDKATKI